MKAFLITIDTEGDNLWKWDRKTPISTENSAYLRRFQRVCNAYEFKPTYLVNYEMAMDDYFVEWVVPEIESNHCEIGMHLHAWNSPPEYILPQEENGLPFLIEYPENVMREKIQYMTDLIEKRFGVRPTSHRAGRWAMNECYFKILSENRYIVDCSVTPNKSWGKQKGQTINSHGSDYTKCSNKPGLIKETNIIEVPFNSSISHDFRLSLKSGLRRNITMLRSSLKGRTLQLRPKKDNLDDIKAFLKRTDAADYQMFMLHSSEFMPGSSPSFPDDKSIEKLYCDIEYIFTYLSKMGYKGMCLSEYAEYLEKGGIGEYEF